jgi:MFS family permease
MKNIEPKKSAPIANVQKDLVTHPGGAFSPLRHHVFAVLWAATILGNIGSFMRDVASGWLVMDLSNSPAAVAAVQAASTLPIFLLAIPAGALSDIIDRRKFLIAVQLYLAVVSTALAIFAATGQMTVTILISLTFLGGAGAALIGPTWQSIVPELIPKKELKEAVALNSLGFNIARAIGPALGGFILAAAGATMTYGIDVISYVFVIAALIWWKRPAKAPNALAEHFGGAVRSGFRFALASKPLHRVLARTALFFFFANVAWALLPLVSRDVLGGNASFYGVMLGAIGGGAVLGALVIPTARNKLGIERLLLFSSLLIASVLAGLSFAPPQWIAVALAILLGAAWIAVLTTLSSTTQGILPNWVRGRGLAVYLMVFNGAMTVGSLTWGTIGEMIGVPNTLIVGAISLAIAAVIAYRYKLPSSDANLTPSNHWPEPTVSEQVANDRGPVLITIEYRVTSENRIAFLKTLERLSEERRRDGAYDWGVTENMTDPENILEWFFVESWAEHLRQHQRVSQADADLQAEVVRFHVGLDTPKVSHYLALDSGAVAGAPSPG